MKWAGLWSGSDGLWVVLERVRVLYKWGLQLEKFHFYKPLLSLQWPFSLSSSSILLRTPTVLLPTLQNPARLTVGRGFPARWPTTLGGGAADGNPFYLINFLLFFLLILSYSFSFSPFFFDFKILNPNHKKNPRSIKYKLKGKLPIFYGNSLICVRF